MKKRITMLMLACLTLLSGCGSNKSETINADYASENFAADSVKSDSAAEEAVENSDGIVTLAANNPDLKENKDIAIQREMLVYSCTMNIDVLDFDEALEKFRTSIEQYEGFIEIENYNDGGSGSRWYNENEMKWSEYSATVRVPSRVYNDFCDSAAELGDLRRKNASVENVSTEYSDLSTTLKIYEEREERYLKMLSEIKNESDALALEDKLTQLQVDIAQLKTRMNKIESDVAYSYIYVTINEVREYSEEPVKNDTFGQRLGNTIKSTWYGFIDFLEGLLFFIIKIAPYAVVIGIFIFIIRALRHKFKKTKTKKITPAPVVPEKPAENNPVEDKPENTEEKK